MILSPKNTAFVEHRIAQLDAEETLVREKIADCESVMANARLDHVNARTEIAVYLDDIADIRTQRDELRAAIA